LDDASEDELGQAVVLRITNRYPVVTDTRLAEYVNLVGLTAAGGSEQPDRNFTFGVLDTDEVGTFAAPGGYVLITRGAVRRMQNEAELAGELARGIAHVTRRHSAKAIRATGLLSDIDEVALSKDQSRRASAFADIADAVTDVVTSQGYSESDESEAANLATGMLELTNYSASAYVDYLKRLQRQAGSVKFAEPTDPEDLSARVQGATAGLEAVEKPGQTLAERFRRYVPQGAAAPSGGARPGAATRPAARPKAPAK
jgi:predicted Zn-dependent protease